MNMGVAYLKCVFVERVVQITYRCAARYFTGLSSWLLGERRQSHTVSPGRVHPHLECFAWAWRVIINMGVAYLKCVFEDRVVTDHIQMRCAVFYRTEQLAVQGETPVTLTLRPVKSTLTWTA